MKQKLSITIDSEIVKLLEAVISEGTFRNKSHAAEYGLRKILREKVNEKS